MNNNNNIDINNLLYNIHLRNETLYKENWLMELQQIK